MNWRPAVAGVARSGDRPQQEMNEFYELETCGRGSGAVRRPATTRDSPCSVLIPAVGRAASLWCQVSEPPVVSIQVSTETLPHSTGFPGALTLRSRPVVYCRVPFFGHFGACERARRRPTREFKRSHPVLMMALLELVGAYSPSAKLPPRTTRTSPVAGPLGSVRGGAG